MFAMVALGSRPLKLDPHPFPTLGLGWKPQHLAHLAGAQRAGIGHHLDHVPVGHRQPAPILILAEDRYRQSHRPLRRRRRGLALRMGTEIEPAPNLVVIPTGEQLGHGLGGDLQPPQQFLLGGHQFGQPVQLGLQRLDPAAGRPLPRLQRLRAQIDELFAAEQDLAEVLGAGRPAERAAVAAVTAHR